MAEQITWRRASPPAMNNLINLSNCKQEIRHHPRLFASDNDNFVVLPDQLRQATLIDFILPAKGQPLHPGFHQIYFSLRSPPLLCLILSIALNIFYRTLPKAQRVYLLLKDSNFTFGTCAYWQPHSVSPRPAQLPFATKVGTR